MVDAVKVAALIAISLIAFSSLSGCRGCACGKSRPPVVVPSAHELELVEEALRPNGYLAAIEELEKSPDTALAAVRRRSATPGSREALVLEIMADRLSAVERHRDWRKKLEGTAETGTPLGREYPQHIPDLSTARHALFWSEYVMFTRGQTEFETAVNHLVRIGGAQPIETLTIAAREPWVSGDLLYNVFDGLARLGQGRAIADGLSFHDGPNVREGERTYARAHARLVIQEKLPAKERMATERELLDELGQNALDDGKRESYVFVLGHVGSVDALPRLAELRRTEWGQRLKSALDDAMATIAERDAGASGKKTP